MNLNDFPKSSTGETLKKHVNDSADNFVTVSKQDLKFKSYIDGTFSKDLIAIPAKNLNLNTQSEQITFRLVKESDIERPALWKMLWLMIRGPMAGMVLAPSFATWTLLKLNGVLVSSVNFWEAIGALWLLQIAVFLYNDFIDYTVGSDRMVSDEKKKYLQLGWIRPIKVLRLAQISLVAGILFGSHLVVKNPEVLSVISIAAAVGIFGYSFPNMGFKRLGLSELAIFWCFGPLITVGLHQLLVPTTMPDQLLLQSFLVGVIFGHVNVMIVQMRQLENSVSDAQLKVRTFAVRLGFDKSKAFLLIQLIGHLALVTAFAWYVTLNVAGALLWAFYISELIRILLRLKAISSPMGSKLTGLSDSLASASIFVALTAAALGIYV
jgi:1,4-dihydroxy-2-naphthoate octaprenyltransferase